MSVDDAFRKLMQSGVANGGVSQPPAPVESPASVVSLEDAPEPISGIEKIDLSRAKRISRFAYHPIDPRSQIAEEYRILRTRLQTFELKHPSILLTSCHHNEGKTSTAYNLALFMAKREKKKILLVDFDLRRPRLHKILGLPEQEHDIASVLKGKCDIEDSLIYSEEDNLYILAAKREYSTGTDFLESKRTLEIIDRMHASFDFVVMDTCPTLSTSDPAVLGPHVGGVVMVVRCLQTQRESVEHAISSLNELGVPVMGLILTFMRYFIPRYLYRYQYYHGYYYNRGYGYGYGEKGDSDSPADEALAEKEHETVDSAVL